MHSFNSVQSFISDLFLPGTCPRWHFSYPKGIIHFIATSLRSGCIWVLSPLSVLWALWYPTSPSSLPPNASGFEQVYLHAPPPSLIHYLTPSNSILSLSVLMRLLYCLRIERLRSLHSHDCGVGALVRLSSRLEGSGHGRAIHRRGGHIRHKDPRTMVRTNTWTIFCIQ